MRRGLGGFLGEFWVVLGRVPAPRSTHGYLQQVEGDDAILVHVHRLEKPCSEGNGIRSLRGKRGRT